LPIASCNALGKLQTERLCKLGRKFARSGLPEQHFVHIDAADRNCSDPGRSVDSNSLTNRPIRHLSTIASPAAVTPSSVASSAVRLTAPGCRRNVLNLK